MADANKVVGQSPQIPNEPIGQLLESVLGAIVKYLKENPALMDRLVKFLFDLLLTRASR